MRHAFDPAYADEYRRIVAAALRHPDVRAMDAELKRLDHSIWLPGNKTKRDSLLGRRNMIIEAMIDDPSLLRPSLVAQSNEACDGSVKDEGREGAAMARRSAFRIVGQG